MKTLGRISIILTAFAIVMGITYVLVNSNSSSSADPVLERGGEGFTRLDGVRLAFANGKRPEFDRDGPRGGGWMFGLIKNIGIVALIVVLIVLPKSVLRRRAISAQVE